jgi:hypothetical protein
MNDSPGTEAVPGRALGPWNRIRNLPATIFLDSPLAEFSTIILPQKKSPRSLEG